ncbi:MAG: hypothetical protein J6J56_00240 [Rikenellaceae bacterium]|nr:hypothetical protein [Rikenellaceae bacterium]
MANLRKWVKIPYNLLLDKELRINISPLLLHIFETMNIRNWVDLEEVYYKVLKDIASQENVGYDSPKDLDQDLKVLKEILIQYLSQISIDKSIIKPLIQELIYEPIQVQDISVAGKTFLDDFLRHRLQAEKSEIKAILLKYKLPLFDYLPEIIEYQRRSPLFEDHLKKLSNKANTIPDYFTLPDNILLLNFNYTNTANFYIEGSFVANINHIHGVLATPESVIFGYGDELDSDYEKLKSLNNNDFLQNMKSIKYLESDNYRKLLLFADSAPFQIYIMGHSCGISDRTLLNTLFEHKNCISIKPFYYQISDTEDNYLEIVQNISRNFNNMQAMRDKVVNKTFCKPFSVKS